MMSESEERQPMYWPLVLVGLAVLAVYWPVARHEFMVWDDALNFYDNPLMQPPTLETIKQAWSRQWAHLYQPITTTFWAAIATVAYDGGGLDPAPFHIASIVVHLLTSLVVYCLLEKLIRSTWGACIGTLLFALHPLQVESVAWASGSKDLLAGFFGLVALWAYVIAIDPRDSTKSARWRRAAYISATVAFVLAMLSKPSAVALPLLAGCIDLILLGRPLRSVSKSLALWLVLTIPIVIVGFMSQPTTGLDTGALWLRPIVAVDALGFYLQQLIAPVELAIDYGRSPTTLRSLPNARFLWLLPVVVGVLAWTQRSRRPWLAAGLAGAVAMLLPVLGILKFDFQRYSTVADHYMYTAIIGPALVVAGLLNERPTWRWFAVGVIVIFGLRSFAQLHTWQNDDRLFTHTLKVNPSSRAGLGNLAHVRDNQARAARRAGDEDRYLKLSDEAIKLYRGAAVVEPENAYVHRSLGDLLRSRGLPAEAVESYRNALKYDPRNAGTMAALGMALAMTGQNEQAMEQFRASLAIKPDDAQTREAMRVVEQVMRQQRGGAQ